jgi:tetratricopeptide (TPR) repeat protein
MGMVHIHRGDFPKAMFHLERAEQDAPVVEGLLRCYVRLDRLRAAEDLLIKANKIGEPTAELLLTCSRTATLLEHRNALLREAKFPEDKADVWRNAVNHYVCAEQASLDGRPADKIESMLQEVFSEGVDYGPAHSLRGLMALERGRLIVANEEAEKALALSGNDPRALLVRGRVRLERAAAGGLQDLEKAARLTQRKDGVILHWLAAAQVNANQRDAALATQKEAAILRPDDRMIQEQLKQLEGKGE